MLNNTPRKIRNQFDNWIAKNFKGLSAYTLLQVMTSKEIADGFCLTYEEVENTIFVNFFNLFMGTDKTDNTWNEFCGYKYVVENANI